MATTMFFGSRSVDWMFGSLEVATTFLLFRWFVRFPFTVFPEAFLVVFPRIQWAIFVAGALGVRNSRFIKSAVCPGWQPLWWGVISFQNLRNLKLGLHFCVDFLASSELIGYIDFTAYCEIWPKCSLVINAKKGVRFFDIANTFPFVGSHVTKIGKYSIRQLQNRFSRQPIGISKRPHTLL